MDSEPGHGTNKQIKEVSQQIDEDWPKVSPWIRSLLPKPFRHVSLNIAKQNTIKLGLQRSLKNVDTVAKINTYIKDKINLNLIKFIT